MRNDLRSPPPPPGRAWAAWLGRRLPLLLNAAVLAFVGYFIYRDYQEGAERARQEEARHATATADRARVFATGDFDKAFELCRSGWTNQLGFYFQPAALAWTRKGIDAYFLEGVDAATWRRVACDAEGVRRGPRVARPAFDALPAEASPGLDAAVEENWSHALHELAGSPLAGGDLAVELFSDPRTGAVIRRRWRGLEGGARPEVDPPGGADFPTLVGAPDFTYSPGAAPPPLPPLPRRHWLVEADAAFAVIEKALPAGAGISEITLEDGEIDVSVEASIPAFEGDPPAPYGDQEFDEYGVADRTWWYPRTEPGFGCPKGRPLAEVRAAFQSARGRLPAGATLDRAWYSCSPAYSDGKRGTWNLVAD